MKAENLRMPSLRAAALLAVASSAGAWAMGAYFGAAAGGAAGFFAMWLLTLSALALPWNGRALAASALWGAAFAALRVLGHSYDRIDSYGLVMGSMGKLAGAAAAFAALWACAACAAMLAMHALGRLAASDADAASGAGARRVGLLCAAMIFAGSLPYLWLYAPGLNIFDTHDQLLQAFGYPSYIGDGSALSDHHPVFLTVVYAAFMRVGLALGDANIGQLLYSLLSMAALALCFGLSLGMLARMGLGARRAAAIGAFVALDPVFALYAFNMCKDVSAMPFVLLFALQMILIERTRGVCATRGFCAGLFANALLLMLTRKAALAAMLFALPFVLVRHRARAGRLAAALGGAALLFAVGYSRLLLPALGVVPGETREMLSIPFQQTARAIVQYDDMTPEEEAAVARVIDIEHARAHYDPRLSDDVKDTTNPDMTTGDLLAYLRAWASMGLRHPGCYIDAWLNMIYGYFYPSESNTIVCLTLNSPDEGGMNLTQDASLAGARRELHNIIYFRLRRIPLFGALFYVDTVAWAFLLLLLFIVARGGIGAAWPYMFFVGTLGICMLSPKSGEIRYVMPLMYALPLMLGAALLPDAGREGGKP